MPRPINDAFIAHWVERLRATIPDAVAVILKGSYARGNPGPWSDLDVDVLTAGAEREEYPAFIANVDNRLVHVSVAVRDLAGWLAEEASPAGWAFGLPAVEAMRLDWAASDDLARTLARAERRFPPGEPELEDFVAGLGKVRQAHAINDELALRLAAQDLACLCPSVLRPLNPEVIVGTRREALTAALSFPISPPGYRDDMVRCLGLTSHAASTEEVAQAARRLILGTLATIQPHAGRLEPLLPPALATALVSGDLHRYAAQLGAW